MRFLVIGAGASGSIHIGELKRRGYEVAVYDMDLGRAQTLAAKHGAKAVEWAEATGGDYGCAVVCVPARWHFEVAAQQLGLGRQVVCEKPLALLPFDAETMGVIDPARLFVAESQCYAGEDGLDILTMQKRIEGGEFGHPVLWRVCAMTKYRPQAWCKDLSIGGGAFLEGGVHVLTTARVLFGEAIRWQASVRRSFTGEAAPDSGTFIIDYECGDQLTLQIGWGTEGCFTGDCEPLPNSFGLIGPRRCEAWWPSDNHSAMWGHLLKCLAGEAEPVATLHDAAGAVADCWKCYAAAGVTF